MHEDALEVSVLDVIEETLPRPPVTFDIILSAAPGIAFIWGEIWITFATLIWSVGHYLAPGIVGQAIAGCVFIGPAIWASWEIMVRAIASERELAAHGY